MLDATLQPYQIQVLSLSNTNCTHSLNETKSSIFLLNCMLWLWVVQLHAILKMHSESRSTHEVKLKESCRTAYAAQTRSFPIQTHNHDK